MGTPHRDDRELHFLTDVLCRKLDVTEILFDVKGKLAVLLGLDDTFAVLQADDDALRTQTHYSQVVDC